MARGLIGRLTHGERDLDEVGSIIAHLRVLLNTRCGDSPCAPEYGVADLTDLWLSLPDAIAALERQLRDAIERYEPRLAQVRVRHVPVDASLELHFQIHARLASNPQRALRLTTFVDSSGHFDVDG